MKHFSKVLLIITIAFGSKVNAQQWDGLTYYSVANSTVGFLIDTASAVVKSWTFTGGTGYSTHFMPGGTFFRSVNYSGKILTGGGMTGRIQKVDYSGNVLWDYTYSSSTYCLHHDHCPLPNGNVLVISYDVRTPTEATVAGAASPLTVWSEKIMELQPVGTNSANVVWEWKLWDHLLQDQDPLGANYYSSIVDNPQVLNINYLLKKDWVHMNGIDYNPVLDQICLSSHNLNEWYIIDHSTTTAEAAGHTGGIAGKGGDFLYRWGNPAAYNAGFTKVLNVTHDAHWIPENCANGGNLAGINNKGITTPSMKTTADQAIVPRSGYNYTYTQGSAFSPSTFSSRLVGTGYTSNMGSSQEFPNGNQLICLATLGTIYETGPAGNTLWTKSTGGVTPQSKRYSTCYLNNAAPPQPTITAIGSQLVSTPATTYQWYFNGDLMTGATSQSITANQPGIYLVKTTDQNGCVYAYSAGYNTAPVNPVGLSEVDVFSDLIFYPNPSSGQVYFKGLNEMFTVSVYDHVGKLVLQRDKPEEIDLSSFSNGLYWIKVSTANGAVTKKITLLK